MTDGTGTGPRRPSSRPGLRATRPRSRVDRFAALVEETGTGRHHRRPTDDDTELLALVAVVHQLGRVEQPTVAPRFRDDLHARLLKEFARQQAAARATIPAARGASEAVSATIPPGPRRPAGEVPEGARTGSAQGDLSAEPDPRLASVAAEPDARLASIAAEPDARLASIAEVTQVVRQVRRRLGGRARLAAVAGLTAGALALSGVSVASGDAVPGDPLYSVKRSGEQAQLVLAGSDANRGHLHLEFARTRLVEARQVPAARVGAVLAEMNRELTEGARLLFSAGVSGGNVDQVDVVATFVAQQRADLLDLRASVRTAGDPARASLDLLDAVETRAHELRAALADGCTFTTEDRFGPKPAC